ncbi:hypothetical protein EMCRGX_G014833 [Ephydatia muelleri]
MNNMATRNMREDELVAFGSAEEFERYENDDIQDKFDEDGEIECGSDWCDGGCSNDEGNGDACHEDSDCDVSDGDGCDDSDNGDGFDCDVGDGDGSDDSNNGDGVDEGTGGGAPAGAVRGQSQPRHLLDVYLTRGGCCKDSCLMNYGDLPRKRASALSTLDKKIRKAVVLGMLAVIRDTSGSRNTFQYRLDWSSPVCHLAFCAVIGITYRTLKHWIQQVCSDSDIEPHPHGNCGRPPHHALSRLDKSRVVSFIRNYATINALPDPGRLKGMVRDYVLESGKTMKYCSNIKIQPARSDLCDKCDQMLVLLRHSLSDEKRKEKNDKYNQHLIKAKAYRDSYNTNIEDAEKEWGRKRQKDRDQILGCLDSRIQLSPFTSHAYLDMQMQYSFDYCQQVSLPYSSQQRGTFYFRTPRKVQVFAEQIGKGAVVVVSQLHAFFHLHGLGENRVTLQADNCVGQNKNTTMLWYLAWRVITGQHERIQLNFMLPGHTKFRPDSYFGLFKKHYRRQDHVDNMDDLVDCVRQCGQNVTCVPQLCKDWQYYDWNAYLGQWHNDNEDHAIRHQSHQGDHAEGWSYPQHHTRRLSKPNDAIRDKAKWIVSSTVTVLYEKLREFVHDPKKRDNVCPKPPPSTAGANASCTSRNVPLPLDNDQAGPSTAIPNPPTVEDHVSDDTYSEVQDSEVNDHVPGRRKRRRARSELILAYQCPACDRKYASSQALYQHRRNSHKQSPVAGGGGQSDVTDMVCDGEGSQGPSKRTRRQKSELDRKFSCSLCDKKYASQATLYTHNKNKHRL